MKLFETFQKSSLSVAEGMANATSYFPHQNQGQDFTVQPKQRRLLPSSLHHLTAVIDLLSQTPLSRTVKAVLVFYIEAP